MTHLSPPRVGLTDEQCSSLHIYLRASYGYQKDLLHRLRVLKLSSPREVDLRRLETSCDYASYVLGTLGQAIGYVGSRGKRGLNEQVGHPARKGRG